MCFFSVISLVLLWKSATGTSRSWLHGDRNNERTWFFSFSFLTFLMRWRKPATNPPWNERAQMMADAFWRLRRKRKMSTKRFLLLFSFFESSFLCRCCFVFISSTKIYKFDMLLTKLCYTVLHTDTHTHTHTHKQTHKQKHADGMSGDVLDKKYFQPS